MTEPDTAPDEVPAATGSALDGLRRRRQSKRAERVLDLRVPGTEPAVWVRYGLLPVGRIEKIYEQWNRRKDPDRTVKREAAVLGEACRGVFEVVDGEPVSIDPEDRDGEWPRFGPELAELLGEPTGSVIDLVRALYEEDAIVIGVAQKYGAWIDVDIEERDPSSGN